MDFKVIINIFLIVIIIHLVLNTIKLYFPNSSVEKKEAFGEDEMASLRFLKDIDEPVSESQTPQNCFRKLEDYVDKCDNNFVKASNYYVEDENCVNFSSNVLNLNKFYRKNLDLGANGLQFDSLDAGQLAKLSQIGDQTCYPQRKNGAWEYRDESMMNGGKLVGDVVGFDMFNTGYASYNTDEAINRRCSVKENCNIEPDDIRQGMGYPNHENRELLA